MDFHVVGEPAKQRDLMEFPIVGSMMTDQTERPTSPALLSPRKPPFPGIPSSQRSLKGPPSPQPPATATTRTPRPSSHIPIRSSFPLIMPFLRYAASHQHLLALWAIIFRDNHRHDGWRLQDGVSEVRNCLQETRLSQPVPPLVHPPNLVANHLEQQP